MAKAKSRERRKRSNKNKAKESKGTASDDDEAGDMNRSSNLVDVRRNLGKKGPTLGQLVDENNIIEFAEDQHGSKYLQAKLEDTQTSSHDKNMAVAQLLPRAADLASHSAGNFVIQKIFDVGSVEQKMALADALGIDLLKLAQDTHGCRVVQKAIQCVPRGSQLMLAEKLRDSVIDCIVNMHGNHVIQKCIEQMPPDSVTFIIDAVNKETVRMATNIYGCRVVQRLLEHCAASQLKVMLKKILDDVPKLAQDSYGNYVVQHMLEHGRKEDKKAIIDCVQQNIVEFAKHKCSSNVVEKCLEVATVGEHASVLEAERRYLIATILGVKPEYCADSIGIPAGLENSPIQPMMHDRYGNYIVQRLIEHSQKGERDILKHIIDNANSTLQQSQVGKHIVDAAKREFGS